MLRPVSSPMRRPWTSSLQGGSSTSSAPVPHAAAAASAAPSDVIVLDFDGVLVDSEPEVGKMGRKSYLEGMCTLFDRPTEWTV